MKKKLIKSESIILIQKYHYIIVYFDLYEVTDSSGSTYYELYMRMGKKKTLIAKMNDLDKILKYMEYKMDVMCSRNYGACFSRSK